MDEYSVYSLFLAGLFAISVGALIYSTYKSVKYIDLHKPREKVKGIEKLFIEPPENNLLKKPNNLD